MKRVSVFCASSPYCDEFYNNEAYKLGQMIANVGFEIIYGGGKLGVMGSLADGALSNGGKVIGVIPYFLNDLELGHKHLTKLHVVRTMHERESKLILDCDYIIALPGGTGTFSELLQALAWRQLGLISKPIIVINLNNYYFHLIELFKKAEEESFVNEQHKELWTVVNSCEDAIQIIMQDFPITPIVYNIT
jgi:uncharacterized protein (TIGR00730 family)